MRRAAHMLLAATAAFFALVGNAAAGTYVVTSCGAAGGVNNSWTFEHSSSAMRATNLCAGGSDTDDDVFTTFAGGLGIRTELGQPYPPVGTYGYLRVDVPSPLKITGLRLSGSTHSESDSWRMLSEGDAGELSHCQSNEPGGGVTDACSSGQRGGQQPLPTDFTRNPDPIAATSWLRFGQRCVLNPCHMGSAAHAASTVLFAAAVWVNDPVGPSAALSGVPTEVSAGAAVSGSVVGSDQTGVKRLELLVDGHVVAASDRGCDFTRVLPCESPGGQVSAQLSASLSPGTHSIVGRAIDASGNASSSPATTVTVKTATQPGTTPPITPGTTPPATSPPGTSPPATTPRDSRKAAELRIRSVSRRGSTVRIRGLVAKGCSSAIRVKVTARGRTRTRSLTAPKSGRWAATVSGVRRSGKATVKVSAAASKTCRGADRARRI